MAECGCDGERLCNFHALARDAEIRRAGREAYEGFLGRLGAWWKPDWAENAPEALQGRSEHPAGQAEDGRIVGSMDCHVCGGQKHVYRGLHLCVDCDAMIYFPHLAGRTFFDQEADE